MVKPDEIHPPPPSSQPNGLDNNHAAPNKAIPLAAETAITSATTDSATNPPAVQRKGYAHLFKYVVVGDSGCGKTAVVRRYCKDSFDDVRIYTIGVDFDIKTLPLPSGDDVKLQIWDTAGQERFRNITTSYYRGAHGVVIVYDVTSKASLDGVTNWLQEVRRHANDDVKIIVVGNKLDLCGDSTELYGKETYGQMLGVENPADPESWTEHGIMGFYQTSARTGEGVTRAFQDLTDALVAERLDRKNPLRAGSAMAGAWRRRKSVTSDASDKEFHDGFDTQVNKKSSAGFQAGGDGSTKSGCCTVL